MTNRRRLSATIEADLLIAARDAVAEGRAESLSALVNDALRRQLDHERRLRALGEFIREYEADHGKITEADIQAAERYYRGRTTRVSPRGGAQRKAPRGRRRTA